LSNTQGDHGSGRYHVRRRSAFRNRSTRNMLFV
jgi:hypothetical protein